MNKPASTRFSMARPKHGAGRGLAIAWLVICNLCWGWSFPTMKWCTAIMAREAPAATELAVTATFIGWRFLLAALLYFLLTVRQQGGYTRVEWKGGLATGVCFTGGLFLQIVGLRYTHPSISGFLTALVVIFLPLAQALLLHRAPHPRTWAAAGLAFAGLLILSGGGGGEVARGAPFPYFGELLTVLGSLCFTAQVLFLDRYGRRANTARLTSLMFLVTALLGLLLGPLFPGGTAFYQAGNFQILATSPLFQWTFTTLVVFSTVVAFHLMNAYQPALAPATAGVIYGLEPVFASFFSILLGAESLRGTLALGGGLILGALVLAVRAAPPSPPSPPSPPLPQSRFSAG